MVKVYRLLTATDPATALEKIKDVLTVEGVKFEQFESQLKSTRTPIVVLNIQPILYTRRNWVGLNPFVFISSIVIFVKQSINSDIIVEISINRFRAYLMAFFWTILGLFVGAAMPQPAGPLLFVVTVFIGWFGCVSFLAGYVIRSEIARAIRS